MRLDFLTLRTRISFGFAFICALLCMAGATSFLGFSHLKNHFLHFSGLSGQAILHVKIGRDVTELQRQAQQFTYEGHKTAENKVYVLCKTLEEDLKTAQNSANEKETKRIINKMIEHLDIYGNTFKNVVIERKLRNDLVQNTIRNTAEKAEAGLKAYIQLKQEKIDSTVISAANQLLNGLLGIEKNAFRYFDSLDAEFIKTTKNLFRNIDAGIEELSNNEKDSKAKTLLAEECHLVSEYEDTLLMAVQTTRGYLYLVNVVMAGEASEFLYNADKLKNIAAENMGVIQRHLMYGIQRITFFTLSVTIAALLLGIALSWIVGRSIAVPITQMTNTFNLLAQGDYSDQIPGRDFKDEIGALSRAAEVFKEKNLQTEQLLEKSRSLTNELEANRRELARSNEELEQFVYTVSHDLKTPLVTSMGFIGIINDLAKIGEYEKAISKLYRVVQANKRMGQLINDLLELSRVGRIDKEKHELDMNVILKAFRESMKNRLEKEGFQLILETAFPIIYANESRVLQAFENLMSNAFKYGRNASGENVVKIGSRKNDDEWFFYVKDNGRGIPKEYHEKIFGLFYRLDNTTEGTGIGLSIVQKVMQFHEGRVWVESEPEKGATFWLAFPKK